MQFIVGLGNPGEKYTETRHNIGRALLERLAEQQQAGWQKHTPSHSVRTAVQIGNEPATLVLPETYMNHSGKTVAFLVEKEQAAPDTVVVVYDDVDLAFGELRVSTGRGDGGHKGIKSIIASTKTKAFIRVRIGIARKSWWTGKARRPEGAALPRHVLGRFSASEQRALPALAHTTETVLATIISKGVEAAMNEYN